MVDNSFKLMELQQDNAILREHDEELRNAFLRMQKKDQRVIDHINYLQKRKIYKLLLAIYRFYYQVVREGEWKDFFLWICCKIRKKQNRATPLRIFDPLEVMKGTLLSNRYSCDALMVDDKKVKYKKGDQVFIFAAVPFYDVGGGQRSAQLARTFNAMGKSVHYIYGFPCSEEGIPDIFVPTSSHRFIKDTSLEWFKTRVSENDLVVFEMPYSEFEPFLKHAKAVKAYTVYEHIDNWDTDLGNMFYDEKVFKNYLENCDLITVTARMLGEKIEEFTDREYTYLPNAVNTEIFESSKSYNCPDDLVRGRNGGKTLLYFGSLWGDWFDWEKIFYVAKALPECQINLIGDPSGCADRVAKAPKNIHFLGLKKQTDLPAYLKYTDVALLPFKNCEIGKYVSPLKIFEYIAMNTRVLATPLDDIQNYPNVVCSDTCIGWVHALLEEQPLVDSSGFIAKNNWFARCNVMLDKANVQRHSYPSISVIVLNRNNMSCIFRCVDTLLQHKQPYNYQIIVVDNDSTDGSYELLKKNYSDQISLVKNNKNGCSCGRNLGVQHATGEYLCFLDSDQWIISDHWMDSALKILETQENIGATGWAGGWFEPGRVGGMISDNLVNRAMPSAAMWYRMDLAYLGSGGMILTRSLFEQIEGFDEVYDPTCYEDTDVSAKIRYAGYELAYCPYMGIMHLPHQTTKSGSDGHVSLMDKNGAYFRNKWLQLKPELLQYYVTDDPIEKEVIDIIQSFEGETVFVLPELIDWNTALFQRPHQVALALAQEDAMFIFATPNGFDGVNGISCIADNCYLLEPKYTKTAIEYAWGKGFRVVLDIYSTDYAHFLPWFEQFKDFNCDILYEYIDEISEDITGSVPVATMERHHAFLKDPNVYVVATADKLYDEVVRERGSEVNCINSGNGVDCKHFVCDKDISKVSSEIAEIIKLGKPIIGYYGAIANWFDYELVMKAAQARPQYEFLLIGPHYRDQNLPILKKVKNQPNIHMVGALDYKILPYAASFFTVATIPFLLNEITESTSPIKLFEYMALGKPVVTTDMRECRKYPVVCIAHNAEEYVGLLDQTVAEAQEEDCHDRMRTAAFEHSWQIKAREILQLIEKR